MSEYIIEFNDRGLVPIIVQDNISNEVLMMAWANQEAIDKSFETGFMHYFSRSRSKLWKKGESSGQTQKIVQIRLDCDSDCILALVEQEGVACHTGRKNCFYKTIDKDGSVQINQPVLKDMKDLYGK